MRDAVAARLVQPDYPDAARQRNYGHVYVVVKVDVSAAGAVRGTSIEHSSGDSDIDKATIRAATESIYLPRIENCKAVPGFYLFRADFDRVR